LKNKRKIMILGGRPNGIGQGIEFDYCCVQATLALKEEGFEVKCLQDYHRTKSS